MSALTELSTLLKSLGLPVETGRYSEKAPDRYVVLTPLSDDLTFFADGMPLIEIEEVRLSFFSKGNYLTDKARLTDRLLSEGFVISDRRLLGLDDETGFYHYVLDVAKEYVRKEA